MMLKPRLPSFRLATHLIVIGHRELIIYPIDPNGEILVFDSLFCISQHMRGITICLKFKQKHE